MLTSSPGQGRSSWRNTNNISRVIMSSAEVLTPLSWRTLSKPNQTKWDCAVGAEQTGLHSASCLNPSCGQWDKCSIFIQYHFLHLSLALTPSIELSGNSSISHSSVWSPSYSQASHTIKFRGEEILPSAPVNMFTDITSQPKIFGLSEFCFLLKAP